MSDESWEPCVAGVGDAAEVASLLHDFNTEFDTPTPGVEVLTLRLTRLLARDDTFALLAGTPAVGVAFVVVRPTVWYDGSVALLEELYVRPDLRSRGIGTGLIELLKVTAYDRGVDLIEINVDENDVDAQRFYVRHGYTCTEPGDDERAFYYWQELGPDA